MDFRIFLSVLLVYQHNFRILHWKASGHNFNMIHEWADNYSNNLSVCIDKIAEIAMRLGQQPVNYKEAAELLESYDDHDFTMLEAEDDYCIDCFIRHSDTMFADILKCIEELLQNSELENIKNVGIKSDLESIYSEIDLQYRYINARRKNKENKKEDNEEE